MDAAFPCAPRQRIPPRGRVDARLLHRRELLVVGPYVWSELGVTSANWPERRVTDRQRKADALAWLAAHAVDVVVISPSASASRIRRARALQSGVRVIVLAPDLAAADIIDALRSQVYATFTMPVAPDALRATIRQALEDDRWQSGIEVQSAVPHWIALRVTCRRVNAERLPGPVA